MKSFKDYNIVMINIDGFRRDKITKCSELNNLKNNSIYFSNMYTAAPYTFASLHAIFSGTYPSRNGVNAYYNMFKFKKNIFTTLPEILQKEGYYTACDVISESVMPKQGIIDWNLFDESKVNFIDRHKKLLEKLSNEKKFFLFLHYTETHKHLVREIISKYNQEDNNDDFFNSKVENNNRFDSHLKSCSDYISTIITTLKEIGIYEKTVLLIFTDHGTSMGEKKGEKFYGVFTYDYTIGVFLIIHIPGNESKIISKQCRTIDIFPTIIELLGITEAKNIDKIQGENLIKLIDVNSENEREVFVETGGLYGPWPSPKKHNVFCIRKNNKKLIFNDTPQTWEFYDLESDPEEKENIFDDNSEIIQQMKKLLIKHLYDNKIITNISN